MLKSAWLHTWLITQNITLPSLWQYCIVSELEYGLKFKLSAIKYAEENSGEAAARRFSVDPKKVSDWRNNKTELSEEDSNRVRLPGGGRKKASEEPEINMRGWVISKRACHERVSRKMIRAMAKQMYATVSDSRGQEFAMSSGWLHRFLHCNNFTCRRRTNCPAGCQRIHWEAGEVCDIFITDFWEEGIKQLSQIATWWLKQINTPAIICFFILVWEIPRLRQNSNISSEFTHLGLENPFCC